MEFHRTGQILPTAGHQTRHCRYREGSTSMWKKERHMRILSDTIIKQEELKESASLRLPSNNRENEKKKKKFQTHGCPPSETGQQAAAHLTSYRRYIFNPERCFPLTLNLLRRPSSFVLVDGRYGSKSGGVSFGKFSQSIPKRGLNNRFSELKLWEMSDRQLREFMFAS